MKGTIVKYKWLLTELIIILSFGVSGTSFAQATDSLSPYQQKPYVPYFKLMKVDSSLFIMKDAVAKNNAAVIILFSPTCSHCQHQAEEITSHMQQLKDITFVFATTYPLPEIKQYVNSFGLDHFPNIYVGQDRSTNLVDFYKLRGLPGIFIYDKKGMLVKTFNTNVKAEEIEDALK